MVRNVWKLSLSLILALCFMGQAYAADVPITILTEPGDNVWVYFGLGPEELYDYDGDGETIVELPQGDSAVAYNRLDMGATWHYAKITVDESGITDLVQWGTRAMGSWRLTPDPFTVTNLPPPVTITILTELGDNPVWVYIGMGPEELYDEDGDGETIVDLPQGVSGIAYCRLDLVTDTWIWYYAKITVDQSGITDLVEWSPTHAMGDWRLTADPFTVYSIPVDIDALCAELGALIDLQVPPTGIYKNHGQYVSMVAHAANLLVDAEFYLSDEEAEELHSCLVSTRAKLDVGRKKK